LEVIVMQDPFPRRCSLCDGTGFTPGRVPCPECSGPNRLSGTSATESADAFQRHLTRIFGDAAGAGATGAADEDWSQLSELALYQKLLGVDRRYLLEMANTTPGRATRDTADRLAAIAADYGRIAVLARGGLLDPPDIQRKGADALWAQGQAYQSIDDLAAAERAYREAAALYHQLGVTSEAARVERLVRELQLRRDRDVDDAVAGLRARLETQDDVVDRAAAQVDLAEIHLGRHDDLEAQRLFEAAENGLMEKYRDHVTGRGTARSLTESLKALMSEDPLEKDTPPIETVMHVRALLQQIYAGMTQLLRGVDPDRARAYLEARTQMEGSIDDRSKENSDFSQEMLKSVQSLISLFDRDMGDRGDS
jgi:tetratricopeptide (TPR) repeat protein